MSLSIALLATDAPPRVEPPPDVDPLLPLVAAVRQGDRAATRTLLVALTPSVRQVLGATLGYGHPDLDDVAQECLVAIVRALGSFRGECRVRHYAARIAVRIAREARARRRRHDQRHDPIDAHEPAHDDAPEDVRARARRSALWQRLLATLPETQAEAMILRVALDVSLEEIAEVTGVPVNTVRSRVRLAREALREQIERNPRYADLLEASR